LIAVLIRHDSQLPKQDLTECRTQDEIDCSETLAPVISDERGLQRTARGLPVWVRLPNLVLAGRKTCIRVGHLELARTVGYQRHLAQQIGCRECRAVR